jgi:hypothetical protein
LSFDSHPLLRIPFGWGIAAFCDDVARFCRVTAESYGAEMSMLQRELGDVLPLESATLVSAPWFVHPDS